MKASRQADKLIQTDNKQTDDTRSEDKGLNQPLKQTVKPTKNADKQTTNHSISSGLDEK